MRKNNKTKRRSSELHSTNKGSNKITKRFLSRKRAESRKYMLSKYASTNIHTSNTLKEIS